MGFEQAQIDLYQQTIVDVLAETAQRVGTFYDLRRDAAITGPFIDEAGKLKHPSEFDAAMAETCQHATAILHEIGGLPLRYTDSVSQALTSVWGFGINTYGIASDTWTIASTTNGLPPAHNQLITEVQITTPKLREAYADAIAPTTDDFHSHPLNPREP